MATQTLVRPTTPHPRPPLPRPVRPYPVTAREQHSPSIRILLGGPRLRACAADDDLPGATAPALRAPLAVPVSRRSAGVRITRRGGSRCSWR